MVEAAEAAAVIMAAEAAAGRRALDRGRVVEEAADPMMYRV